MNLYDVKGGWGTKGAKLILNHFHSCDPSETERSTWTTKGNNRPSHGRHHSVVQTHSNHIL